MQVRRAVRTRLQSEAGIRDPDIAMEPAQDSGNTQLDISVE
jgi:hypothetical protein